jgi:hypothetical protein
MDTKETFRSEGVRGPVQSGTIPPVVAGVQTQGASGLIEAFGVAESVVLLGALITVQVYLIVPDPDRLPGWFLTDPVGTRNEGGGLLGFRRYDEPSAFTGLRAVALASIVRPAEGYVLGIDCADRWFLSRRGTKLVLTDERVVAFCPDPSGPVKRSYRLDEVTSVGYEPGLLTAEFRIRGPGSYETYPVPKRLGEEFVDAVRSRLDPDGT